MKSTAEHPFLFFDDYFENQIQKDLKEFYTNITEELYFNNIEEIDKVRHIIKVPNIHHKEKTQADYITFSFEGSIKSKLKREINITKNVIENEFQKRFADKKEVTAYADFLRIKLKQYYTNKNIEEFPFLKKYFDEITSLINQYSKQTIIISNESHYSFNLIANTTEEQFAVAEKLHNLLSETPAIIKCDKADFINAFTGKEINQGIYWLITGKNKFTSKISLFYFIEELRKKQYLKSNIIPDLSKYIKYVFRDNHGNELKNLKQSKSTYSKSVTQKERIDTIISSL
ncbi:hypothetical protein [Tenacibaculum maritimum]|uniref:hypothetical protein n=1 Tax=Tenacibaculum maritimum TaxID=107401 RepID=UPI0012E4E470|nr:hypothetical protein [Tenacibaculum maritimum]CAA0240479.1 conserved hypothetical protein [Tenacibaculum maritimum]